MAYTTKDFLGDLIWIGAVVILLWALAKSFGWINSPAWIEMIPFFAGAGSVIGGAFKIGQMSKTLNNVDTKVGAVKTELDELNSSFLTVKHNQEECISGRRHNSPYWRNNKGR